MYKKILLTLPEEVADNLVALEGTNRELLKQYIVALRQRGWTLESIAVPLGKSRERIRQLELEVFDTRDAIVIAETAGLELPLPPHKPIVLRTPRVVVEPNPEVIARLRELQPLAQKVRSSGGSYRAEAEEYTRLLNDENVRGVSLYRLAKELDVTHAALRFRLVRYGYKSSGSTAKVYQPILDKNRLSV